MELIEHNLQPCTICNNVYTDIHIEIRPGQKIYVCEECAEAATYNFIWLCLHCGRAFLRPKNIIINETTDEALKEAYILCIDTQVIQGIEMCKECDPNGTERYMKLHITNMEC